MDDPIERLLGFDPFGSSQGPLPVPAPLRYLLLDVFTATPLQGNQLAVVLDGRGLRERQMQAVARELNLSETVFVLPPRAVGDLRIRIFTPAGELPFAGHPTLGSAIVAGSGLGLTTVTLETARGEVPVVLGAGPGGAPFGRMEQPIPTVSAFAREGDLLEALGLECSLLPVEAYCNGPNHVYVELAGEHELSRLRPDLAALSELGQVDIYCFAGSGTRWRSRMFAPAFGLSEDPATGSAAGPLAVHLARHGRIGFGEEIEIRQGQEIGRPSLLYARAVGAAEGVERVEVGGSAVIVGRGEIHRLTAEQEVGRA